MQNPLWDYATKVYGAHEVESACLALQDRFGLDVNLLLYAAWLAHSDRMLDAEHLAALAASTRDWRDQVIRPLRTVRRQLHGKMGVADLYDGLKALEIRAEREQLDQMYVFSRSAQALPTAHQPLHENLEAVARFARPGDESCEAVIGSLAALLSP
jgi:uncharacterized protein (TIGR02444 family)